MLGGQALRALYEKIVEQDLKALQVRNLNIINEDYHQIYLQLRFSRLECSQHLIQPSSIASGLQSSPVG